MRITAVYTSSTNWRTINPCAILCNARAARRILIYRVRAAILPKNACLMTATAFNTFLNFLFAGSMRISDCNFIAATFFLEKRRFIILLRDNAWIRIASFFSMKNCFRLRCIRYTDCIPIAAVATAAKYLLLNSSNAVHSLVRRKARLLPKTKSVGCSEASDELLYLSPDTFLFFIRSMHFA